MLTRALAVVIGLLLTVGPQAGAVDLVTWGTAQNITGDSDVSSNGSLVYAYNLGASGVTDTTVNGVLFSAWAFPANNSVQSTSIGSTSFTESSGSLRSYNTLGTGSGNFNGLSSVYQAMLSTAGTSTQPNTVSLTMGGLTSGATYEIQWWLNNSSLQTFSSNSEAYQQTTSSATNSVLLIANVGTTAGNLGQYVTGSFTANSSSAVIAFNGTGSYSGYKNRPMINAFQLRVTAVPEPSTYVLSVFAISTLAFLARRRTKQVVLA